MGLQAGGVGVRTDEAQDRRRVRTDGGSMGAGRPRAFTPGTGEPWHF